MELQDISGRYSQIKEFPDYYITDFGEVYSTRLRGNETTPHLHKLTPKNPGKGNKYLNIILCNANGQVTKSIHRLVAEHFVDGYFDGAVVNHIDGNNRNNIATNLEWVSVKDNVHKSYLTSGIHAKRNYKTWELHEPSGNIVAAFTNHLDMERYVKEHHLDAAPTQLTKHRQSRGYYILN